MGLRRLGVVSLSVAAFVLAFASGAGAVPTARIAKVGPAPRQTPLSLVFPLKADLAGLRQATLAITTPGSPAYGDYQPFARLARRFGATTSTRRRVIAFLRHASARGVRIDPTGLFANATLPAGTAARLFAIPLAQFRAQGERFIAPAGSAKSAHVAAAAHIPAGLGGLVTGVVGLDNRLLVGATHLRASRRRTAHAASLPTSARKRTGTPSGCAGALATGGFTPNQYLTAYGYAGLHAAGLSGQGQRVALIEIDGFDSKDLDTFAACFGIARPAITPWSVNGSPLLKPGGEATLDLEILDAAAPKLAGIDVFETKASAAGVLNALTAPLRTEHPHHKPAVISASLGICERRLQHFIGDNAILSTEGALEMASASGVTFVASSGDQGSADCPSSNGGILRRLAVNYPSSSWWVTGVGGTNLELSPSNAITSQFVWNDAAAQPGSAGGGGLSDLFDRPNYQSGSTHAKNRAVPDVSLLSDVAPGYAIYCSASDPNCISDGATNPWESLGGTSAATPLLAGGFALIDQQLAAAHKQPLGLVNPLLYALYRRHAATVFSDVTQFGNDIGADLGDHTPLGCCAAGPGYDEASGLGSVNLGSLAGAAVSRQPPIVAVSASVPRGQRPVHQRAITVTVTCTAACTTGAYALVSIGHAKPFEVNSSVVRLAVAGRRRLALRFSAHELRLLRSALAHTTHVGAKIRGVRFDPTVYGVLFAAASSIVSRTGPITLTISG